MADLLNGNVNPMQALHSELNQLLQSERQSIDQEKFNLDNVDKDYVRFGMAKEVGDSLGVSNDYFDSPEGQQTLFDILEFLQQEHGVTEKERISNTLVQVLNSILVPKQYDRQNGLADRLKDFLKQKKQQAMDRESIERDARIWKPKAQW